MQNRPLSWLLAALLIWAASHTSRAQNPTPSQLLTSEAETEEIVVTATRIDLPIDQSPASVSVINLWDLEIKQTKRVAEALREVPGLSVVETGAPGQLTSVFTRGLNSAHTQVLLDGIPINQGLSGAMNFADLTTDNIDRIEVVRGPQSTLYGPRALAGVIQIFTRRGEDSPSGSFSAEGGSFDTFRESVQSQGKVGQFDYSAGASRVDTDNDRPNNEYRNTAAVANLGWSPNAQLRLGGLFTYSNSDTGNPNRITTPSPFDNLLTERWLIAPNINFKPVDWWTHKLIVSYDHERQINDPNNDGFVFATRALFKRLTIDYQNDLKPVSWLTLTSGFFYSDLDAEQERPFVLFGDKLISDHAEQTGAFLQAMVTPVKNLIFVAGGRYDHFNDSGDVWTYRFAGSYKIEQTHTTFHSSVATGFSPPSSQDKIFRSNLDVELDPEEVFGWDVGVDQSLWGNRVSVGATYFYNDLSNVIGFDGLFNTFNLGSAQTQGVEFEMHATPIADLILSAAYTYLDTEKTSSADINQPEGARLARRPRNEVYVSASYLWWKKLRTTLSAKWVNAREEINFGGPNFDLEDYTLVNFAAEYEINSRFSIFARIDNLTNEQYEEVFDFPNLGRAAYGGLKVRF
jgi:vitamin B12 transporter